MLFKSLLVTCCVALLSPLIEAGPIVMDALPTTTTTTALSSSTPVTSSTTPPVTVSTPVDTSIHVHSTNKINTFQYSVGYFDCWSYDRESLVVATEHLDASAYTHIIFGYAVVNGSSKLEFIPDPLNTDFSEEEDKDILKPDFSEEENKDILNTDFSEIEDKDILNTDFREEKKKDILKKLLNSVTLLNDFFKTFLSSSNSKLRYPNNILKKSVNSVKLRYPNVKVIVSVIIFGNNDELKMVQEKENRRKFIQSAKGFMEEYELHGIDFAWENPFQGDRDGNKGDKENFVSLFKEMRDEFKDQYTISSALPLADAYYKEGLNVQNMAPNLDFITIMAYAIHGPWNYKKSIEMRPHADMKDVKNGMNLLLSNKHIPKNKLLLGLAFGGWAYKQADPDKSDIGDSYCDPENEEDEDDLFKQLDGYSSYKLIKCIKNANDDDKFRIRKEYSDQSSVSKVMVFGKDMWVAYDDAVTIPERMKYAEENGFGGISAVYLDQDDEEGSLSKAIKNYFGRN